MKKLSLDLETLSVESFHTVSTAVNAHGTVRGQEADPAAADFFALSLRPCRTYTCPNTA